jgi:putative transcriptional regulator
MIINRVRELRTESGITQDKFAEALQITRQSVIAIEKNKYNPSLELAMKIAEYFHCSVEDIFYLNDGN